MTTDHWINAVDSLLGSVGNAVHRPLLLLLLLKRAREKQSRELPFIEAEKSLADILGELGSAKRPEVLLPFWHLKSTDFWEVLDEDAIPKRKGKDRPTRAGLVGAKAVGAVKSEWWATLTNDPQLVSTLTESIVMRVWKTDADRARVRDFLK
jgi:hypothetical protein